MVAVQPETFRVMFVPGHCIHKTPAISSRKPTACHPCCHRQCDRKFQHFSASPVSSLRVYPTSGTESMYFCIVYWRTLSMSTYMFSLNSEAFTAWICGRWPPFLQIFGTQSKARIMHSGSNELPNLRFRHIFDDPQRVR